MVGSYPQSAGTRIEGRAARHVRSIALDLIFTLLTFGLFNLYVQNRQMKAVNAMLGDDRYHFWMWLLLTIITVGIYHVYHEYRKSVDIARAMGDGNGQNEGLISVILTAFGLFIVADAIQQSQINRYFGSTKL